VHWHVQQPAEESGAEHRAKNKSWVWGGGDVGQKSRMIPGFCADLHYPDFPTYSVHRRGPASPHSCTLRLCGLEPTDVAQQSQARLPLNHARGSVGPVSYRNPGQCSQQPKGQECPLDEVTLLSQGQSEGS
jgi:hypothetical protein